MTTRFLARWVFTPLFLILAVAACESGDDGTGPADGTASLSVYLTDAPGDVARVWVKIEEMTLMGDEGAISLLDEPTDLIEITDLVGKTQEIVDGAEIPAGTYGQLRLRIENAVLETASGDVYVLGDAEHPDELEATGTLLCPSCSQSGLKIVLHGMEVTEGESALVLDFDVSQSFGHQAGNSGKWVMRPVIHSTHYPNGEEGVYVEGQVALADGVEIPSCPAETPRDLTAFIPTATAQTLVDGDGLAVVRTGNVGDDGEFKVNYLEPDTYTLGYETSIEFSGWALEFTATVEPAEVTVGEENLDGVLYTITAATCTEVAVGG